VYGLSHGYFVLSSVSLSSAEMSCRACGLQKANGISWGFVAFYGKHKGVVVVGAEEERR